MNQTTTENSRPSQQTMSIHSNPKKLVDNNCEAESFDSAIIVNQPS